MSDTLETFLETLEPYAVDIKLNAKGLLEGKNLTKKQSMIIFLSCAFGSKNKALFEKTLASAQAAGISEGEINGAKIAATIMSMTNVYYRFTHLIANKEYEKMPLNLRMNKMRDAVSEMEAVDFELCSFAVSALNGCSGCLSSHEINLKKHNVEVIKIQDAAKIAAIVHALSVLIACQ